MLSKPNGLVSVDWLGRAVQCYPLCATLIIVMGLMVLLIIGFNNAASEAASKELIVIKMTPDAEYLRCGRLCGELWGIPVLQIYSRWRQTAGPLIKDEGDWLHCVQRRETQASRSLEGEAQQFYNIHKLVLECDRKLRVFELVDITFR